MTIGIAEITAFVGSFYLPLTRVAALLAIAPVIGGSQVPMRIRAGLAVLLALLLMPLAGEAPAIDPLSAQGVLLIGKEMLIGLAMGFTLLVVFNAIILAGENIAMTMGLGFAVMSDPQNGMQLPVIGQFYSIVGTLLFLAFNGHHALLELLAESFSGIPLDQAPEVAVFWSLLEWAGILFRGAVSVALPTVAALLSVNLVMGVMTRAAPQMNIFSVGFPVTMSVGFLLMMLTLPAFMPVFESLLADALGTVSSLMTGG